MAPEQTTSPITETLPVSADGVVLHTTPGLGHLAPVTPTERPTAEGWGTRMRDFLTDGSVAALCDELARLAGTPIWLRDQNGEAIVPVWSDGESEGHGYPWSIVNEHAARKRAFELIGLPDDGSLEPYAIPLRISTGVLGAIVTCLPRRAGISSDADSAASLASVAARAQSVRRALLLLASSVCDVCEAQVSLRRRVLELDALYRLSSLLTAAGDTDDLLKIALDLAIQVLRVDAGTISILDDQGGAGPSDPVRQPQTVVAHRGVSPEWIANNLTLSHGGELRRVALHGGVVRIEDLTRDPRIEDLARVRAEGLRGFLSTGLLDQGRPIGLIRLYTKEPRVFTEAEGELLRAIAEHSASALTNARLRLLRAQDEQTTRQVRLAAAVQRRMLPRTVPHIGPFDVAAHYAPSYDLGGDFYDFLELGGHLGIIIGDVVGKGVPAALLMSAVRASIRAHAQDVYHIDEVLSRVNRALSRDTLDNEFATVWYGVADPHSLRLTYCGAGHDWPLLASVPPSPQNGGRPIEDKDVQRLTADGMALGIDPSQKYPKGTFHLKPRDVLVCFTDGLHDATNFEGKRFGGTRLRKALLEVLAGEPEASASRIIDHILAQVRQHTGMSGRSDDITIVVLRVKG